MVEATDLWLKISNLKKRDDTSMKMSSLGSEKNRMVFLTDRNYLVC
jgi:hypothetical protein